MRILTLCLTLSATPLLAAEPLAPVPNDYPTEARADYVFGCMATNGQTREALTKCACSIDTIASILPYDGYVAAETVLQLRQGGGERAAMFKGGTASVNDMLAALRRAQAEAEMLCFQ